MTSYRPFNTLTHFDNCTATFTDWQSLDGPEQWRTSLQLAIDACREHRPGHWDGYRYLNEASVAALAVGLYLCSLESGEDPAQVNLDVFRALLSKRNTEHSTSSVSLLDLWRARITAAGHMIGDDQDPVSVCWSYLELDLTPDYSAFTTSGQRALDEDSDLLVGYALTHVLPSIAPAAPDMERMIALFSDNGYVTPEEKYEEALAARNRLWPERRIWSPGRNSTSTH